MDVAIQMGGPGAAGLATADAGRPLAGAGPQPGQLNASNEATVLRFSEAFGGPAGARKVDVSGLVDRMRADFDKFRLRMEQKIDPSIVNPRPTNTKNMEQRLAEAMHDSIRTQYDLMQFSVTFNVGISAAHQSQGGVKTLIEKS